jgi:hypothetical protein
MNKYPFTHTKKNQERTIINEILVNNNYSEQTMYQKQKLPKPRVEKKTLAHLHVVRTRNQNDHQIV